MTLAQSLPKRLPMVLLATAVVFAAVIPAHLHAADQDKKFKLLFSDKPNDPAPRAALPLRPTVQQKFFVYVQNTTAEKATVTVDVLAGGAPVDGTLQTIDVEGGKVAQVKFGKEAAPPAPAPAPAAPPAPAPKPQPPALEEVKGALQVRVLDKDHKEVFDAADLQVARPTDYITIDPKQISYDPKPKNGRKNLLTVHVKASDNFAGPKCRIDLVLRPDRIPGLIDSPRKEGTRGGYLTKAGGELVLTAENLEFKEGVDRKNGFVYLTIDGYERAFTFSTTFPSDEGQEGKPTPVNAPIVRLDAPGVVNPGSPLPVGIEVDNAAGDLVELGFDRNNDGQFKEDNDEILKFAGARHVRMLASAAGPGGCLLLQPEIQDWKAELDAGAVFGKRTLRVRLLGDNNTELAFIDARQAILETAPELVKQIIQTVVLDSSPPEGVKFVDLPPTLPRGADLPVKAAGFDPDSDIKEVVFYLGKPGPDGAAPPMAVKAPGKLIDKEKHLWAAALSAPTDQKGKLDVTAQFTNGANLTASDTVTIQLVDPTAPGAAAAPVKGGSVEGVVTEGGRGQPGLEVRLSDDKGMVKDSVKTDDKGHYLFKDVPAGTYKVSAVKTTDSTKGDTGVQVVDGVKKLGVDVKLTR